jgi:DUF2075 family protein
MIVYSETKKDFLSDVLSGLIKDKIHDSLKKKLGHSVGTSELSSYQNSMMFMNNVLSDAAIPEDSRIAIEYRIPRTIKRVDFILTGKNENDRSTAVIVELKQWSDAEMTTKDGVVSTRFGHGEKEVAHPSYQAWSYAALLEDYNEEVEKDNIQLKPCAYLHNYAQDGVMDNDFYKEHIDKAPLFFKTDAVKLRDFIKQYVKYGDAKDIMYQIDNGRIRPSKNLADNLASLIKGNQEFIMIDDQKVVYETAINLANESNAQNKNVLIIEGGPGTGKSVVAINLLVELIKKGLNTQYVTKNAAPRAVYESKLAGTISKTRINNLFSGSGAFTATEANLFDALIVDEAHRLNAKSGMMQNLGENQVKEIINSSKLSIFFLDEDQQVTLKDIGEKMEIYKHAYQLKAKVHAMSLSSQFRCNGSDAYLAWLDNTLQIKETANETLEGTDYDFRIMNSVVELRDMIFEKNKTNNKARLVAGYCWDWISKGSRDKSIKDIVLEDGDFAMQWNLTDYGSLWLTDENSINEVGCIHTCQGLELDYVGVIIGPDMIVREGLILTDASKRSKNDSSIRGYKKLLQEEPINGQRKLDIRIKNTYRTLMTRGMKGCYVYFTDKVTEDYFKKKISSQIFI